MAAQLGMRVAEARAAAEKAGGLKLQSQQPLQELVLFEDDDQRVNGTTDDVLAKLTLPDVAKDAVECKDKYDYNNDDEDDDDDDRDTEPPE